ncbi:MAG: hypothetical protein M0P71_01435 [Melioribacteraceae bacterium]|nr:hypothetical protein [Melioribacteraceae bacterium]
MNTLTYDEKVALFQQTASDPVRRSEFAQSRAMVILPLLDTQSTIRSIFAPEQLPVGAQPTYDIPFDDVNCAWVMPKIGGIPQIQVEGTEISVSTFGLEAAVEYQMDVAEQGRFNVAERATTLLKNKVIDQEELAGWTLIHTHAATLDASQKVSDTGLNVSAFNKLVTAGDVLRRKITDLYVSPSRFSDMRSWVESSTYSQNMKDNAFNQSGLTNVWGVNIHKVYNPALVSNDKAYAFGQRDGVTYGVMPIRKNLTTFDNPLSIMSWKVGIMAREILGFAVLDEKGLIEVTFTA